MQSEQIDKIAAALAKAQGAFASIKKDKTASIRSNNGASYSYSYADLASVIDAIRKPLAENGIAYIQAIQTVDSGMYLDTRLIHSSGQWISSTYPLPAGGRAQEMGSAQTYARRYALCALVGVVAEDDDDGDNAADTKPTQAKRPDPSPPVPPQTPPQQTRAGFALTNPNGTIGQALGRPGEWLDALTAAMEGGDDPQAWWEVNRSLAEEIAGKYKQAKPIVDRLRKMADDYGREVAA